jgi:hypothetical protein
MMGQERANCAVRRSAQPWRVRRDVQQASDQDDERSLSLGSG